VRFLQVDIDGLFGCVDYGISRLPLNVPICGRDCLLHGTGICGWLAVDRSCNCVDSNYRGHRAEGSLAATCGDAQVEQRVFCVAGDDLGAGGVGREADSAWEIGEVRRSCFHEFDGVGFRGLRAV
jgi:hypothetical protein